MGLSCKRLSSVQELRGKHVLAALLVLTVLVCHGAYGAMHQVMSDSDPAMQGHLAQVAHAGNGETLARLAAILFPASLTAHAEDGGAADVLAHAAALIFVSAVVLWLLIGIASRQHTGPRPSLLFLRLSSPATSRCPPPPAVSTLQVFRL